MTFNFDSCPDSFSTHSQLPLTVDELINYVRKKWNVTYDFQLVVRKKNLYLQMMWGFLEQQSFPMDEVAYREHLNEILEVINRLGKAKLVRDWLVANDQKPRLGRAISLPLKVDPSLNEFLL